MPRNARKTRWYSTGGPWGTGLMLLGVAVLVQGLAYMTADDRQLRAALTWIDHAVPIAGWGLLWICAGIWSIWRGLSPPQRHIDLVPPVGVICLWGGFYFAYWLTNGLTEGVWTRDWTSAVAWGSLASVLICFGRCINPPRSDK